MKTPSSLGVNQFLSGVLAPWSSVSGGHSGAAPLLLQHGDPDAKMAWEKGKVCRPQPEPPSPQIQTPSAPSWDQMPSSPDSAPSERAVGALKTKGIPGESGKLLGWKVIKGLSVGGDFHGESQAREQAWAGWLQSCCPLEVCRNGAHKTRVIRDLKPGLVFRKTEIGGNPKALEQRAVHQRGASRSGGV